MQPEDIPRAAPLVIVIYGQESDKDTLARRLAQDGYDVRSLKHAIVLRTPTGSAGRGVKRTLRGGEFAGPGARILRHGKLSIDTAARTATFASASISLRRREYELLVYLARDPTRVYTRHELLRDVWRYRSEGTTRTSTAMPRAYAVRSLRPERTVGFARRAASAIGSRRSVA